MQVNAQRSGVVPRSFSNQQRAIQQSCAAERISVPIYSMRTPRPATPMTLQNLLRAINCVFMAHCLYMNLTAQQLQEGEYTEAHQWQCCGLRTVELNTFAY